jgi:hypothetical protein
VEKVTIRQLAPNSQVGYLGEVSTSSMGMIMRPLTTLLFASLFASQAHAQLTFTTWNV